MAKEPTYVRIARANAESQLHIKHAARIMMLLELSNVDDLKNHYARIKEQMTKSSGTFFMSRIKHKGY